MAVCECVSVCVCASSDGCPVPTALWGGLGAAGGSDWPPQVCVIGALMGLILAGGSNQAFTSKRCSPDVAAFNLLSCGSVDHQLQNVSLTSVLAQRPLPCGPLNGCEQSFAAADMLSAAAERSARR